MIEPVGGRGRASSSLMQRRSGIEERGSPESEVEGGDNAIYRSTSVQQQVEGGTTAPEVGVQESGRVREIARGWMAEGRAVRWHRVGDKVFRSSENGSKDLLRLRGRQARLDVIMKIVRERQNELHCLSEHRAVSDFPHRNKIQFLLRSRFLKNGKHPSDERPPSTGARKLGKVKQSHTISALRSMFSLRLENAIETQPICQPGNFSSHSEASSHLDIVDVQAPTEELFGNENAVRAPLEILDGQSHQETEVVQTDNIELEDSTPIENNWSKEDAVQSLIGYMECVDEDSEENMNHSWSHEASEDENMEEGYKPLMENGSLGIAENLLNRFTQSYEDKAYKAETRELLTRRTVSNLLSSQFRDRLDLLLQSHVRRNGHLYPNLDQEGSFSESALPDEDEGRNMEEQSQQEHVSASRTPLGTGTSSMILKQI